MLYVEHLKLRRDLRPRAAGVPAHAERRRAESDDDQPTQLTGRLHALEDRLTVIPDPTVQRFAPKLIASLDRAINFCNDTLRYGRAEDFSKE